MGSSMHPHHHKMCSSQLTPSSQLHTGLIPAPFLVRNRAGTTRSSSFRGSLDHLNTAVCGPGGELRACLLVATRAALLEICGWEQLGVPAPLLLIWRRDHAHNTKGQRNFSGLFLRLPAAISQHSRDASRRLLPSMANNK